MTGLNMKRDPPLSGGGNNLTGIGVEKDSGSGVLRVVDSGDPYKHTGTTDETTIKEGDGVLNSIYIPADLTGDVTITIDTITFTIPTGAVGFHELKLNFYELFKVQLAQSADVLIIGYL